MQFSEGSIRDATGVWLKTYVVQGIHYMMSFAEPNDNQERGHQSQLRADDRTARRHGAYWRVALSALVANYDGTQWEAQA